MQQHLLTALLRIILYATQCIPARADEGFCHHLADDLTDGMEWRMSPEGECGRDAVSADGEMHILHFRGVGPDLEEDIRVVKDVVGRRERIRLEPGEAGIGIHLRANMVGKATVGVAGSSRQRSAVLFLEQILDEEGCRVLSVVRAGVGAHADVDHSGLAECFGLFEDVLHPIGHGGCPVRGTQGARHHDDVRLRCYPLVLPVAQAIACSGAGHGRAVPLRIHRQSGAAGVQLFLRVLAPISVGNGGRTTTRRNLIPVSIHTRLIVLVAEVRMGDVESGIDDAEDHTCAIIPLWQGTDPGMYLVHACFHAHGIVHQRAGGQVELEVMHGRFVGQGPDGGDRNPCRDKLRPLVRHASSMGTHGLGNGRCITVDEQAHFAHAF